MTVKNDIVLWDNGTDEFCLFSIPNEAQYKYIDNIPALHLEFLAKTLLKEIKI